MDGSSNHSGSGAGVILERPAGIVIEQSLHFEFKASNNQAEYEALLAGMRLAQELEVKKLTAKSDSKLVTSQVNGEYQTRDPQLVKYWEKARKMASTFESFTLVHVPRDHNEQANLLAKLASTQRRQQKSVIHESLHSPTVNQPEVGCVDGKDTRRGFALPLLKCVNESESEYVIKEVHEGICGTHIGGQALASKIARVGYYWPTMRNDCIDFVKRCDKCQRFAEDHKAPPERLHSIMAPWPFHKWGIDILGPFLIAPGQLKFLIVTVDYFTKWVEAEPVATISAERAEAANKVILRGIRKHLEEAKGRWADELSQVLWSYHTTPHSTTGETPFHLTYGTEVVIPVEIGEPSPRMTFFELGNNEEELRANLDLLQEVREIAHVKEYAVKVRAAKKYNERLMPRRFKITDLVLRRVTRKGECNKLSSLWEGPFRIIGEVRRGAYRLEHLDGKKVPDNGRPKRLVWGYELHKLRERAT
ncbi:Gypsy retrotransposon integrase-like protein 1, partial [Mucuna pruriens]